MQLVSLLLGVSLGVLGLVAYQRGLPARLGASQSVDPLPGGEGKVIEVAKRLLEPPQPTRVIYLNREGAELRGGPDDAGFNVSSVVAASPGNRARIPPFAGSAVRWNAIARCIRQKFEPFDVTVVEQRPVQGDYLMALLGGKPDDLGFHKQDGHSHSHAIGLAPFNSEPIPRAVVFIFTRALRENTKNSCEAAGMEIAHAYGLDHARNCKDLMTYMRPCGARVFLDRAIECGEHEARACANGEPTQNSFQHLLSVLGPAPEVAAAQ